MHRKLKVIVVEDDAHLRAAFCSTLSQDTGIVTVEAADIEQAIKICHNEPQLTLLVDPGLPNLTGVEAITVLHKTLPGAALVAITGADNLRDDALAAGATDVIIKASPESHGQGLIDTIRKAAIQHETEIQFSPGWEILAEIRKRLGDSKELKKIVTAAIISVVFLGTWRQNAQAEAGRMRAGNEAKVMAGERAAERFYSPPTGS